MTYNHGQNFMASDGCNLCHCYNGTTGCTRMYCYEGQSRYKKICGKLSHLYFSSQNFIVLNKLLEHVMLQILNNG